MVRANPWTRYGVTWRVLLHARIMREKLPLRFAIVVGLLATAFMPLQSEAQYFGRNKVQYDNFDFRIFETQHFRLHFYPEEEEAARDMARMPSAASSGRRSTVQTSRDPAPSSSTSTVPW